MFGTQSPGRSRLLAVMILAVIFAAGGLAGAAGRALVASEPERPARDRDNNPRGQRGSILLEPGVFEVLQVTPEQKAELQRMLAERDTQIVAIWKEVDPRIKQVIRQTHKEIRGVLDVAQEARLDSLLEARRERYRQEHNHRDGDRNGRSGPDSSGAQKKPEN